MMQWPPEDVVREHNKICEQCHIRKTIARIFDMHFYWIDCPYVCENSYEYWMKKNNWSCQNSGRQS